MRKCIRCGCEMKENCAVKIEGAGYGIVLSSDENKLFGGRMPIDKVGVNLFYLPKKRLAFEFIIFHGKEVAFVNLALFNDGTAFAYLPVLPCDFFLGAYPFARFIIEHAACGSLDVRLRKQFSFAEDKMDMIIGFAFVVVEG